MTALTQAERGGLTKAERRALEAVQRGECWRLYDAKGNKMQGPKGVGATTLWRVLGRGLIEDGRGEARGVLVARIPLKLTRNGKRALEQAP